MSVEQEETEATAKTGSPVRQKVGKVASLSGGRGGALIILVGLVLVFSVLSEDFRSGNNLLNILRQYSVTMMLAVGMTLVIVARGIDLSVAATAALSGSMMGVAFAHWGWPEPFALLFGLAGGVAVGAFNGFVITRWRVPDFVATLGTLTAVRGIALLVTDGLPVPDAASAVEGRTMPATVELLGGGGIGRFPYIAVVALACVLVGGFILGQTKLGRSAYAVGGNPDAARMSGIKVERTKMWVYILSGLFAGIAGLLLAGRQGSANALSADQLELQAIAAVVVGGTNLFGGEGRVSGTVVGMLVIGVLSNGLAIIGVSDFWQRVVNGLVIVLVVALDQWRRRATRVTGVT